MLASSGSYRRVRLQPISLSGRARSVIGIGAVRRARGAAAARSARAPLSVAGSQQAVAAEVVEARAAQGMLPSAAIIRLNARRPSKARGNR